MNDGSPTLEVGFAIETGGSFEQLLQLQRVMDSAEAKIVADAANIERATGGMVKLGGATAQVTVFGNAATREMANATRATNQAERSGEALVRQMQRQVDTFGKTASEVRNMRAEMRALAAEQRGLTELAGRIRSLNAEMNRLESAGGSAAGAVDRNLGAVRTSGRLAGSDISNLAFQFQDLGVQMAAAAGSSAPLKMAFMALLQQGSQIQGIMSQAGVGIGEVFRQFGLMTGILREVGTAEKAIAGAKEATAAANGSVTTSNIAVGATAKSAAVAERELAAAFAAAAGGAQGAAAANAQVAASNGAAAASAGRLAVVMTPLGMTAAVAAVALGGFALGVRALQEEANEGAPMKAYAASLGLTAKEIRNLDDVTVTFGDTTKAVFQVAGAAIWGSIGPAVTSTWKVMQEWLAAIGSETKRAVNHLIGLWVGGFNAVRATWSMLPAVIGDAFFGTVNAGVDAINALVRTSVSGLNMLVEQANRILPNALQLPTVKAGQVDRVKNEHAGAAAKAGKAWSSAIKEAVKVDYLGDFAAKASSAIDAQAEKNARTRLRKQMEEKGYLDPEKGKEDEAKVDRHAERLAREADAVEAQIRNLYALAAAYKVSGAEALIAEARSRQSLRRSRSGPTSRSW
jgi:hypothetical protein